MRFTALGLALLISACGGEQPAASTGDGEPPTAGGQGGSPATGGSGGSAGEGVGGSGGEAGQGGGCGLVVNGTAYLQRDYETEVAGDVWADDVGEMVYVPGGGFEGSNAWELHLFGDQGAEDHCGWTSAWEEGVIPEGATQRMFVGHLLYMSSGMVDRMVIDGVGGKMLDVFMFPHDLTYRQVIAWRGGWPTDLLAPRLVKGGAGIPYYQQLDGQAFDLASYRDQWVWFEYEFNAAERYTAAWVRTADGVFTGARETPLMQRFADEPSDWIWKEGKEEPYEYSAQGWMGPGQIWGYWGDLEGVEFTNADFIRLDNLVISDDWIEPPCL